MTEAARKEIARITALAGLNPDVVGDWFITSKQLAYVLACQLAGGDGMAVAALKQAHDEEYDG